MLVRRTTSSWKAAFRHSCLHPHQPWHLITLREGHKQYPPRTGMVLLSSASPQVEADKDGYMSFNIPENAGSEHSKKERFRIRQGTIQTNRPSTIAQSEILKAIDTRFLMKSKSWKKFAKDKEQAVVILATPAFAKWLEDDRFISSCIDRLTYSVTQDKKAHKAANVQLQKGISAEFEVDVLCACVDGLSPSANWMPYAIGQRAKEGFSILQGETTDILPELWYPESSSIARSPTMTASLTFSEVAEYQRPRSRTEIVLPLANTLFSNGRHSTLLVSKWRAQSDSFVKVRSIEKNDQMICAFDTQGEAPLSVFVPSIPLTPARRIVSGLGNIVKQIDFKEDGSGPASRELEASIDEYLALTGREKSTIAVWALIVPKALEVPPPQFPLLRTREGVRNQWHQMALSDDFIGHWVRQGAKFCRVLSGGGGWGVKQGLLSLDPQTTFSILNEARFDFSMGSIQEQQNSALGDIAEVDASIQFFVANTALPAEPPLTHPSHGHVWRRTTVIGTVPSTIDDKKIDESSSFKGHDIAYVPGHFGAVSESGMFLRTLPRSISGDEISTDPSINTKIDLPYSYIYRDMANERDSIRNGRGGKLSTKGSGSTDAAPEAYLRKVFTNTSATRVEAKRAGRSILIKRLFSKENMPQKPAQIRKVDSLRIRKYTPTGRKAQVSKTDELSSP